MTTEFIGRFNEVQKHVLRQDSEGTLTYFDLGMVIGSDEQPGGLWDVLLNRGERLLCNYLNSANITPGCHVLVLSDLPKTIGIIIGVLYPLDLPMGPDFEDEDLQDFTTPRIASDISDATVGPEP